MEDIDKLLKYAQESSDAYLVIGQITEGDSIHFWFINFSKWIHCPMVCYNLITKSALRVLIFLKYKIYERDPKKQYRTDPDLN